MPCFVLFSWFFLHPSPLTGVFLLCPPVLVLFFCSIHDLLSNRTFLFLVLLCSYCLLSFSKRKVGSLATYLTSSVYASTFWCKCMCFTLTHSLPHPTPMYCMLTKFYYTICDKQLSLFFFFSRHSKDHHPNKKKYLQLIHKFIYTIHKFMYRNGSI